MYLSFKDFKWYFPKGFGLDMDLRMDRECYFYELINETTAKIEEIYRIRNEVTVRAPLMSWTKSLGFQAEEAYELNFYKRRGDFRGIHLKGVAANNMPNSYFTKVDKKSNQIMDLEGTNPDVFESMSESLNFTFAAYESKSFGVLLENGSWSSGIINELTNRRVS